MESILSLPIPTKSLLHVYNNTHTFQQRVGVAEALLSTGMWASRIEQVPQTQTNRMLCVSVTSQGGPGHGQLERHQNNFTGFG